jgi:hypothetical protein
VKLTIEDRAKNLWKDLFDMGVIREDVDYMEAGIGEIEQQLRQAVQDRPVKVVASHEIADHLTEGWVPGQLVPLQPEDPQEPRVEIIWHFTAGTIAALRQNVLVFDQLLRHLEDTPPQIRGPVQIYAEFCYWPEEDDA